jgi:hypothetical protein
VSITFRLVLGVTAVTVLAVSACGSSPPSAKSLTAKIPGCGPYAGTPGTSVYAQQDAQCQLQDGTVVEVATFANQADERSWITHWGGYGACCLEGDSWAATVDDSTADSQQPDWQTVESALGGKRVSNNP